MNDYKAARAEVSRLFGIKPKMITYVLYKKGVENLYTSYDIPKKNGGTRVIYAPDSKLNKIQKKISEKLYEIHINYMNQEKIKSTISHGFEKNKGIITNAYRHKNKRYLVNVDISDFFSSFNFGRVQGYFHKSQEFGFSKEVSTIIAQLVCHNGKLPQGAPTSPIISNLIFNIVDRRILTLAKKYKLYYTRYADDMSFSTNNKEFQKEYKGFIQELTDLLEKSGFMINHNKTRFVYYSSRQEVTGLTVNNKINASRNFINQTRAMANQLYKKDNFQINGKDGTLAQLEGRFSFINQLDWFNNRLEYKRTNKKKNKKYISDLNAREKQYQYFLFYKYFFKPIKPTIVTEGKTDILHIKAALMKYCDRYPKLITKSADGKYEFKLYFLNKTKRLEYFLGIYREGADTMKNIWNFYKGAHGFTNIFSYLSKKCLGDSLNRVNPVILLFDNEQVTDKPLRKFLNHIGIKAKINPDLMNLTANLYLQTISLINDFDECEIEDLYSEDILNIIIKGKKFEKTVEKDKEDTFSKDIFSKYILEHYYEIDFSNFIPLLDSINDVCKTD